MTFIERCLAIREVAKKWFYKFNTKKLDEKDIIEFNKDLETYNLDFDIVYNKMTDYYIEYLEETIKKLNGK